MMFRSTHIKWLVLIAAVLIVIGCGIKLFSYKMKEKLAIKTEYQAVFLTNGQVYFGKMEMERGWFILRDIYYLQKSENLQATNETTPPASSTPSITDPNVQLVKLGSELHGPEDEMFIAKDKIMFWENLKADSKVVQTIKKGN